MKDNIFLILNKLYYHDEYQAQLKELIAQKIAGTEYFKDVETTEGHNGYFCIIGRMITIVIPCYSWIFNSTGKMDKYLKKHYALN